MKMRKFVTVVLVLTFILTMAVPVQAANTAKTTKVATWHTKEFREMYARMKNAEEWQELDEEVQEQLDNYAQSETRRKGESILICQTINLEVYANKKQAEDSVIGRLIDILSSTEFRTCLLLSKLAEYDGIRVGKNEKGEYAVFKTDIPE